MGSEMCIRDSLLSLKHNMKYVYDISKNVHLENKSHTPRLDRIEAKQDTLSNKVDRLLVFHIGVTKHHNSNIFPLQSREAVLDFLDPDHPDYEERLKEFKNLMLLTVTDDMSKFVAALLEKKISRDFAAKFKWPPPGYII